MSGEIERVFREQYGRAVAVLVRHFGDIDAAEEAVQDAFTVAVARWPSDGVPPSPVAVAALRAVYADWRRIYPALKGVGATDPVAIA